MLDDLPVAQSKNSAPAGYLKSKDASSIRAVVLIGVAAAFCATFVTKPCVASKLAELHNPVACPPQWLPVLVASNSHEGNATLHAALVRLHQEDPSATRRLLQPLQACSYESNVLYDDAAKTFGADPLFGADAQPAGQYDASYKFWTPTQSSPIGGGPLITNWEAQSRVIPFTHADCCLRCQLLSGCQGVRSPATLLNQFRRPFSTCGHYLEHGTPLGRSLHSTLTSSLPGPGSATSRQTWA